VPYFLEIIAETRLREDVVKSVPSTPLTGNIHHGIVAPITETLRLCTVQVAYVAVYTFSWLGHGIPLVFVDCYEAVPCTNVTSPQAW
jgi:hypothetical protein